jgi:hypothetical protein
MLDVLVLPFLPWLTPVLVALVLVIGASLGAWGQRSRNLLVLAGACAVPLALGYGGVVVLDQAGPLARDVAGAAVLCAMPPVLAACGIVALRARTRHAWVPPLLAGVAGLAWALAAPLLLLLVHCSSGDCL